MENNQATLAVEEEYVGNPEEQVTDQAPQTEEISIDSMSDRKFGEKTEVPNLDGEVRKIKEVKLTADKLERRTEKSNKVYRTVIAKVIFEDDNFTNLGGLRQYKYDSGWSSPTFWAEGTNAIAEMFALWLQKIGKQKEDVSTREFISSLIGMDVKLKYREIQYSGKTYPKNTIAEFI